MRGEIVAPVLFRGPPVSKCADVLPQFVAHTECFGRLHAGFLIRPPAALAGRNCSPVTASEGDEILFAHQPENNTANASQSENAASESGVASPSLQGVVGDAEGLETLVQVVGGGHFEDE